MSIFCCGRKNDSLKKANDKNPSRQIDESDMQSKRLELVKSANVAKIPLEEAILSKRVKGLENLGNTCYINAALECLSNTPEFTEYILTGQWQDDANGVNPIGTDGILLVEYVKLIHKLWKEGDKKRINPEKFKTVLDKVCSTVAILNLV